jgi:hypothetical protein
MHRHITDSPVHIKSQQDLSHDTIDGCPPRPGMSFDKPKSQSNWKSKYALPYHLLTDDGTALKGWYHEGAAELLNGG